CMLREKSRRSILLSGSLATSNGAHFAHLFPLGWGFVPNSETFAKLEIAYLLRDRHSLSKQRESRLLLSGIPCLKRRYKQNTQLFGRGLLRRIKQHARIIHSVSDLLLSKRYAN